MSYTESQTALGFFDAPVPFDEPAAWVGPEVDLPNVIVNCLEADIFPQAGCETLIP
jgi:hypothetical protein